MPRTRRTPNIAIVDQPARPAADAPLVNGVSRTRLRALLASAASAKESLDAIATAYGAEVREAVARGNLHKPAYDVIRKLSRMTPEKLAEWLEHFFDMLEKAGLSERAASAPRLPNTSDPREAQGEGEGFPASTFQPVGSGADNDARSDRTLQAAE